MLLSQFFKKYRLRDQLQPDVSLCVQEMDQSDVDVYLVVKCLKTCTFIFNDQQEENTVA